MTHPASTFGARGVEARLLALPDVPPVSVVLSDGRRLHGLQTGWVAVKTAHERLRVPEALRFPAILADPRWAAPKPLLSWVLEHPEGLIVVDAGEVAAANDLPTYTRGADPGTRLFVTRNLRVRVAPERELGPQLRALGLSPNDVRLVVQTHLHFDHAGGLRHVPRAEVLVARAEIEGHRRFPQGALTPAWPTGFDPRPVDLAEQPCGPFARALPSPARATCSSCPRPATATATSRCSCAAANATTCSRATSPSTRGSCSAARSRASSTTSRSPATASTACAASSRRRPRCSSPRTIRGRSTGSRAAPPPFSAPVSNAGVPADAPLPPSAAREALRRELLDVAGRLLDEDGPHALSTRRIAGRAGTSTMSIYALFGGKDGLAAALYVGGFDDLEAAMRAPPPRGTGAARVLDLNRRYRRFALARPARYALMFERIVPGFLPPPAALERARRSLDPLVEAVAFGVGHQGWRVASAEDAAVRLWAAAHGLVNVELAGHLPPDAASGMLDRTVLDLLRAWGAPDAP